MLMHDIYPLGFERTRQRSAVTGHRSTHGLRPSDRLDGVSSIGRRFNQHVLDPVPNSF